MMTNSALTCLLAICCLSASGAQYYVDSRAGDNNNPGTSQRKPWRSLEKMDTALPTCAIALPADCGAFQARGHETDVMSPIGGTARDAQEGQASAERPE